MLTKDHLCFECEKLNDEGMCGVYGWGGMAYRNKMGMCPVTDRFATWREDKPKAEQKKKTNPLKKSKRR